MQQINASICVLLSSHPLHLLLGGQNLPVNTQGYTDVMTKNFLYYFRVDFHTQQVSNCAKS